MNETERIYLENDNIPSISELLGEEYDMTSYDEIVEQLVGEYLCQK